MRGPDGEIYHITYEELKPFRVPSHVSKNVNEARVFDEFVLGEARTLKDVGLSSDEEPTATGIVDLSQILRK